MVVINAQAAGRAWLISRQPRTVAGIRSAIEALFLACLGAPRNLAMARGRKLGPRRWRGTLTIQKERKKAFPLSMSQATYPSWLAQVSGFFRGLVSIFSHNTAELRLAVHTCIGQELGFPKGPKGCEDRLGGQCVWRSKSCSSLLSRLRPGGDFQALVNTTYFHVPQVLASRLRRLTVMKSGTGIFGEYGSNMLNVWSVGFRTS